MKNNNRIYEEKSNKKKNKSITFRLSEQDANILEEKVRNSDMNRTDFIKNAYLNGKISTVNGAKNLTKALHDFHTLVEKLPKGKITEEFIDSVSLYVINLMKEAKL